MRVGVLLVMLTVAGLGAAGNPRPASEGAALSGKAAFRGAEQGFSTAISVSAWAKLHGTGASQVFVNQGRANSCFTFYLYKGGVRMLIAHEEGAYAHALAPKPPAGEWTHYAGTYDGRVIKAYMNGELMATTPAVGRMTGEANDLFIGALNPRERFLYGWLEDIRIWDRALSNAEVADVYRGVENAGLDEGVQGWWLARNRQGDAWPSEAPGRITAMEFEKTGVLINGKDTGYRGIWYYNQPSGDEYVYKYSGGLGTYCAKHIPHAWYVPEVNKTFFTWGGSYEDRNHLLHMVSYYDHETGLVPRPTILLDKETDDAHDNPVISVDGDGYIWIFSSSHGTGRPSYISRSTAPHSIDQFELMWTGNYSYPQPWPIPGKGWLFVHVWYGVGGRSIQQMTSADGVHWSEREILSFIAKGHYEVSRRWGDKVGVAFNYHPEEIGLNYRTNLYYMESDDLGKTWKAADGTVLATPLSEVANPALAHDYEADKLLVYMKDINFDDKGNPIVLYITSKGYQSGPDNMPRTWTTARWTGSAWDIQGGDIVSDNNYDTGSLYVESGTLWRIVGPTEVGPQPYNPGGEMALWESHDQGNSWDKVRQMTVHSKYNHTYARRPVNAHPDFYAFWADGHGRQPSDSRLYFCNDQGDVFRLPVTMTEDTARPEVVKPDSASSE